MTEEHPLYHELRAKMIGAMLQRHIKRYGEKLSSNVDQVIEKQVDIYLEAIVPELNRMILAEEILGSEPFLWLMCGSDYNDTHLDSLRPAFQAWVEKGDKTWGLE